MGKKGGCAPHKLHKEPVEKKESIWRFAKTKERGAPNAKICSSKPMLPGGSTQAFPPVPNTIGFGDWCHLVDAETMEILLSIINE
jgi:hypothetical protein